MGKQISGIEEARSIDDREMLRLCVERLKSLVDWDYLWARARENAAGDLIGAVDSARADIRQLLDCLNKGEGEQMSQTDLAMLESLDEIGVEMAVRVCVNTLRLLREWMFVWVARAEEGEAVDEISNMRKNRDYVDRLVALFDGTDEKEPLALMVGEVPLAEAEGIVDKTMVHSNLPGNLKVIVEHCDHEGTGKWVSVSLGNRRYIYLCPFCAGLMRWEMIRALVHEASVGVGSWGVQMSGVPGGG